MSIIIYTCPECGKDLQEEMIATFPPIHVKKCYSCGWSSETKEDVIRIPYEKQNSNNYYFSDTICVPKPCKNCANHPSNGGSGICYCVAGSQFSTIY